MVEFSGGVSSSNEILLNEAYIFGLDGLPMFLALALLNVVHPGTILKGTQSEFPRLTRKQKKELKRQKKEQKQQKKAEKKAGRKAGYVSESVLLEANGYEMDN